MKSKCCNPSAPVKLCFVCKSKVYTCELEEPINNDYRCTVHKDGIESNDGRWFCSDVCYNKLNEYF